MWGVEYEIPLAVLIPSSWENEDEDDVKVVDVKGKRKRRASRGKLGEGKVSGRRQTSVKQARSRSRRRMAEAGETSSDEMWG